LSRALIFFLLILSFKIEAQNYFNKRFDYNNSATENGFSLYADSIFYYVIIESLYNDGFGNLLTTAMLKMDLYGNVIDTDFYYMPLAFTYAGGSQSLNKISDGFILGGSYRDSVNTDAMLYKISNNGSLTWSKSFGDSLYQSGWMARPSHDGNYLICGETTTYDTTRMGDMLLIKTDTSGNIIWENHYGSLAEEDLAVSFVETIDHGFALAGSRTLPGPDEYMNIIKVDSTGSFQWQKIIGGPDGDMIWSIISTSDGNILIAGNKSYGQSSRPYLAKLDLSGNFLWQKEFGDTNQNSQFNSVRELSDGSIILAGTYGPPSAKSVGMIFKLNNSGDTTWTRTYTVAVKSPNELNDIFSTTDGGFIACGTARTQLPDTGNQDVWILKIDSNGCEIANCAVGINELIESSTPVKIYPNPFSNYFNIEVKNDFEKYDAEIYNSLGEEILSKSFSGNTKIATDYLPDGLYVLNVCSKGKRIYSKKILQIQN
jgi:hypothetical protein